MLLEQYDIEYAVPIPFGTGLYYWTHSFIYDLDNPPVGITSQGRIHEISHLGTLTSVFESRAQKTQPPYSGTPYIKFEVAGHPHGLIPAGEQWSIFNTVRMTYYSSGRAVGYKRWRTPLRAGDTVGDLLSTDIYNHFVFTIAPGLLSAKICSREGFPIDQIIVSPLVHQWQWRHGTKRRTGHVIHIP
jgi:hypothetical protein